MKTASLKKLQVQQHDRTDCGPACLSAIGRYYGLEWPLERIRQESGTDAKGSHVKGLLQAARAMHLEGKAYKIEDYRPEVPLLPDLPCPCITHHRMPDGLLHYMVLARVGAGHYWVMDPEEGLLRKVKAARFHQSFTGHFITFAPAEGFKKGRFTLPFSTVMGRLLYRHRKPLATALILAVLISAAGIFSAFFIQQTLDRIIPSQDAGQLARWSGLLALVLFGSLGLGLLRSRILLRCSLQVSCALMSDFLGHLLRLPLDFFQRRQSGELASRLKDSSLISLFLNAGLQTLVLSAGLLLASLGLMFHYHWKLTLACLVFVPLYYAVYAAFDKKNRRGQRRLMQEAARLEAGFIDRLKAVADLKLLTAEERAQALTQGELEAYRAQGLRSGLAALTANTWGEGITHLLTLTILWAGAALVMGRGLSVGALVSFYTLSAWFSGPIAQLIGFNRAYRDASIACNRLFEIMELHTEEQLRVEGLSPQACAVSAAPDFGKEALLFDNVGFAYPGRAPLLQHFTWQLPVQGITGLTGCNGCGKSTLALLATRLHRPQEGCLWLGNHKIDQYDSRLWRTQVALVPQQPHFIKGSLAENILLGNPLLDLGQGESPETVQARIRDCEARMVELCRALGLEEFLDALPQGLHTQIGVQGPNISGGQQQKLALLRALMRDPQCLILDEATNAMDRGAEQLVQAFLQARSQRLQTVLLISHNPAILAWADRIYEMKNGCIHKL